MWTNHERSERVRRIEALADDPRQPNERGSTERSRQDGRVPGAAYLAFCMARSIFLLCFTGVVRPIYLAFRFTPHGRQSRETRCFPSDEHHCRQNIDAAIVALHSQHR